MICNMRGVISTSFHFGRACLINASLLSTSMPIFAILCVPHDLQDHGMCKVVFFWFFFTQFFFSNFQISKVEMEKSMGGPAYMHVHVFYVTSKAIEIFATCMCVRIHGAACFMQCPPTPRQSTAQPNAAQRILIQFCLSFADASPLISLPPASFPFPTFSSNTSYCIAHYLPPSLLERKHIVRWLGTMVNAPLSILYLFFAKSPSSHFPLPFPPFS